MATSTLQCRLDRCLGTPGPMSATMSLKIRVREERSSAKMGATVPVEQPVPPVAREADSENMSPGVGVARGRGASGAWSSGRCLIPFMPT